MEFTKEQGKKKVPVIAVDEQELRSHVSEVVRQSVEETLGGLLEAEADALCQAKRYERDTQRASTRACYYERGLQTKAGTVQLKVIAVRLRRKKKVQNFRGLWYEDVAQPLATQGDFGLESP